MNKPTLLLLASLSLNAHAGRFSDFCDKFLKPAHTDPYPLADEPTERLIQLFEWSADKDAKVELEFRLSHGMLSKAEMPIVLLLLGGGNG